ncbi:hypothetical protein CE91St36_19970 [Christensenellaceae bacterium]|nr:hypothetical protein CE91St36_19970 [Christensenellaceae bacterium]BDF61846.1 hypothetical protein CE91St37_19960 [Christensenellaceae bacterium]
MKRKYRILTTFILVVAFCIAFTGTAFAADEGVIVQGAAGEQKTASTGATIVGTVQPLMISAVVPTIVVFEIDPNKPAFYETNTSQDENKAFTTAEFSFTNECNAPLTFSVSSMAASGDAPEIVEADAFSDDEWKDLNRTKTNGNIAFGFTLPSYDEWQAVDNEDAWFSPATALPLGDAVGHSTVKASLKAKYGMSWGYPSTSTIIYEVAYGVSIAE